MGISRLTLYEIAGNLEDIVVTFGGPNKTGKYTGWITRGPERLLVNSAPIFDSPEDAKRAMQELVNWARDFTEEDLQKEDNPLRKFLLSSEPV